MRGDLPDSGKWADELLAKEPGHWVSTAWLLAGVAGTELGEDKVLVMPDRAVLIPCIVQSCEALADMLNARTSPVGERPSQHEQGSPCGTPEAQHSPHYGT